MDSQLLRRVSDVFSSLSQPYTLFDHRGRLVYGSVEQPVQPPLDIPGNHPTYLQGAMFLKIEAGEGFILMTQDSPSAADNLIMAAAMVQVIFEAQSSVSQKTRGFQQLLSGELSHSEVEAVLKENHAAGEGPRAVLLISVKTPGVQAAETVLKNILPLDAQDMLVPMSRHTVALIKSMPQASDHEELYELAAAMQDTALSEEGLSLSIGIGDTAATPFELCKSYRQAQSAMEIGSVFHPGRSVFVSRTMLLERFLNDIPPDIALSYHQMLFSRKTSRLFSEEMLDTINMFLSKDLNLSDTARQMYIHRNTLVYRLDKVQKQTGLDLRRFEDAMTFKLLFEMKKCAELHPHSHATERK